MASAMVTTQISNHIGDPPLVADMQRPYEDLVSFFKSSVHQRRLTHIRTL
jgi:hypothetical protein